MHFTTAVLQHLIYVQKRVVQILQGPAFLGFNEYCNHFVPKTLVIIGPLLISGLINGLSSYENM